MSDADLKRAWEIIGEHMSPGQRVHDPEALALDIAATFDAISHGSTLTRETEPGEPVAWRGWWAGAGSVDSETHFTTSETRANQWREAGAEVTPLYTCEAAVPSGEKLTAYELQVLIAGGAGTLECGIDCCCPSEAKAVAAAIRKATP